MSRPERCGRRRAPTDRTLRLTAEAQRLRGRGLTLAEIAARFGVTPQYVGLLLGPRRRRRAWTAEQDALLGTAPDAEIAARLGRTPWQVERRRRALGVERFRPPRTWTAAEDALLGTVPDRELASQLGCSPRLVCKRRLLLGIEPWRYTSGAARRKADSSAP